MKTIYYVEDYAPLWFMRYENAKKRAELKGGLVEKVRVTGEEYAQMAWDAVFLDQKFPVTIGV